MKLKIILVLASLIALPGCSTFEKADLNYASNLQRAADNRRLCQQENRIEFNIPGVNGANMDVSLPAPGCDLQPVVHGGAYLADVASTAITSGASLIGTGVSTYYARKNAKDANQARIEIAEINRQADASRDAVLLSAIESNSGNVTPDTESVERIQDAAQAAINANQSVLDEIADLLPPTTENE